MRLTAQQHRVIRRAALDCFGQEARATLFGSRADDTARGGDIDLLIETQFTDPEEIVNAEIRFQVQVQQAIGEQKIDLLVDYPGRGEHTRRSLPSPNERGSGFDRRSSTAAGRCLATVSNVAFQSVDDVMAIVRRIEQNMALPPV